jgi:hypothetical protein
MAPKSISRVFVKLSRKFREYESFYINYVLNFETWIKLVKGKELIEK